ncbi:Uncharacterized protein ChrSV_4719 [Chromobacterium vaccinii]|nr:Uncharacterized protein ChrSW_4719 [Chromobacterium vaccinii]QND92175.1 Uncharacterized protein ChrSV_4719 [Chromobacterium vaccinii]
MSSNYIICRFEKIKNINIHHPCVGLAAKKTQAIVLNWNLTTVNI